MSSTSIVITACISVMITLLLAVFSFLIYKKTKGGSKAYLFWAKSGILLLAGALISFFSSFSMDPNAKLLKGIEGTTAVVLLTFYLFGYFYLALGATFLPGQLNIIHINLEKVSKAKNIIFFAIMVLSSLVLILLAIIDEKIPVRMFYVPVYTIVWLYCFFILFLFYNVVKRYARYWICFLLASACGFFGNLAEILAFFINDDIIILLPISYAFMGIFALLGFYKLGKDLQAF